MILLLALGACSQSKGQDLAACQVEAIKVYPHFRERGDMNDQAEFITYCMFAKGYGFTDRCVTDVGESVFLNRNSEDCYRKPWPWE